MTVIMCDCSTDDFERPSFSAVEIRLARKPHECCECGEMVQPGERYERYSGRWNGKMDSYATCIPCSRIRDDYCPGGFVIGGLREAIGECLGFDYVTGEDWS